MKKEKCLFTYIIADSTAMYIQLEQIGSSILWNNKGIYGLIPFARIQNEIQNWKDSPISVAPIPTGMFHWSETIKVPLQIANALLGEDKDDKCTYRGKNSPNTGSTDS